MIFATGFRPGLAYLAGLGSKAPVKSLAEVIAFNERSKKEEMPFFGQNQFVRAEAKGPLTSKEYRLLEFLMRHPHQTLTRALIAEHVWDDTFDQLTNLIDVPRAAIPAV